MYYEEVRGMIISCDYDTNLYQFFTKEGKAITYNKKEFHCDECAIDWFKSEYPEHYKQGVEMRVWDR